MLACAVVPVALEFVAAARLLGWVRRVPARHGTCPPPERSAAAVDRLLRRAPGPWRHSCLRRAVVLAALLRRSGRDAEVVIGVRRAPAGGFEAHAWLRCDGVEPYLEAEPLRSWMTLQAPGI